MSYYVEDLDGYSRKIKYSNISKENTNTLNSLIEDLMIADRVLKNSKVLNEMYDFDNVITKASHTGDLAVIKETKKILGVYNFQPYQEMNLMMEQLGY